jgi:hypothetical protein
MSELLDNATYNHLIRSDNMTKSQMARVMAHIDNEFHMNETNSQWNERLRTSIQSCFNKIGLRPAQRELFGIWYENVMNIPNNTTRYEIFNCAPEDCLYIVGL